MTGPQADGILARERKYGVLFSFGPFFFGNHNRDRAVTTITKMQEITKSLCRIRKSCLWK